MGSENLFHRRKAKRISNLKRRSARRAPYEKILIVCEGKKTEPNYFDELIQYYKLNTANIEVDGSCESSPISVYEHAKHLHETAKNEGDSYDRVYCVFDRDSHETYKETIRKINSKKHKDIFYAATSVPCFEYWLLLHFNCTTKPFSATGKLSIADTVISELKKFYPNYTKGKKNVFFQLLDRLKFATNNAQITLELSLKNGTVNPSTRIHELIEYLQNLKNK